MTRGAAGRRPLRIVAVAAPLLLIAAVLVVGWTTGMRLFVVDSPSMGTTAPVGTLVVDRPLAGTAPRVGEVVTYRPPVVGASPITHRVVAVGPGGVTTRGDINEVEDPWVTPDQRVIGRVVAILPGLGWLLRGAPLLVAGIVPLLLLTALIRPQAPRIALRMLGVSSVVAVVVAMLRPLLNATVLTTSTAAGAVRAEVVSTGLLPVRVSAGPSSVHLVSGEVGRLVLPMSDSGRYALAANLDVGPIGWALLAAACALPVLWTFVLGPTRVPVETAA